MTSKKPEILIVDDNSANIGLLEAFLEPLGYVLSTAPDGKSALKIFNGKNIDLVLLDIIMPGMDGFEVTKRIRKNREKPYVPVILLSALNDSEDRIKGIKAGCDDFISKPFDRLELKARMKSLLRIKYLNDEVEKRTLLLRNIMNRYIVEDILDKMIDDPDRYLKPGGEKRCATVLFADIRGFTNFSEKRNPEEIMEVLSELFPKWMNAVLKNNGTFDKYLGDGIMAFFSAKKSDETNAYNAIAAAIDIKNEFEIQGYHKFGLGLGIGINSGEVFIGNIGSDAMMEYTVIGDPVNTAQRIESGALPGQILISENTRKLAGGKIKAKEIPAVKLKGKDHNVAVFELLEMV